MKRGNCVREYYNRARVFKIIWGFQGLDLYSEDLELEALYWPVHGNRPVSYRLIVWKNHSMSVRQFQSNDRNCLLDGAKKQSEPRRNMLGPGRAPGYKRGFAVRHVSQIY